MLKIPSKARINIHWKINPYDYSKEKEANILCAASKKYGIFKDRIKVIPDYVMVNSKGEKTSVVYETVGNIQQPQFQLELFREYFKINNIQDIDFELIEKIDSEVNSMIDYSAYESYKRYSIKWIKWSNFLSYGEGNVFNFNELEGLVLLNGEPANQSGKTTFAIDLLHFLLFGKTSKATTQDKIFNKHLKEATEVVVEGCLIIDGEEYIIKRRLTRPSFAKRTAKSKTTQKVEYYKIVNGSLEELEDYVDNQQEENSIQTNKVIKESIGNESDFDMIICATSSNLDELIEKKETERGRLLARWIGLLPIEQKEALAKEKFNSEVKPYLVSTRFNREALKGEIEAYNINLQNITSDIAKMKENIGALEDEIETLESNQRTLLSSRINIDNSLLKIDISTLKNKIERDLNEGLKKKNEVENINKEISEIGEVKFSVEEYNEKNGELKRLQRKIGEVRGEYSSIKKMIHQLKTSEYCPTCGRKYDNVDNSSKIGEMSTQMEEKRKEGMNLSKKIESLEKEIENLAENMSKYQKKSALDIQKAGLEVQQEKLRQSYRESKQLMKEYLANNESIDKNNQLDIQIRNNDAILKTKRQIKENTLNQIRDLVNESNSIGKMIVEKEELIEKITEEVKVLRNWKIYLDMIGKNGISKMVLRKSLPLINAQISHLLSDVCDFSVEVGITEKNDIVFYLEKDGVKSDLTSGSGFERTAAALALRAVLGNIAALPRMSCIVLDEIWGRVAKENYDNLRKLLEEINKSYDFMIIITHLDEVKDFCNTMITVFKEDNISSIKVQAIN